jgi:hypothetical protein
MFTKTTIALATALVLGAAPAALASAGENAEGGFDTLSNGQSAETWKPALQNYMGNGGNDNGYFASPTQQEDLGQSGKKRRNH